MKDADRDLYLKAARCCAQAHYMAEQLGALGYIVSRERAAVTALGEALKRNEARFLAPRSKTRRKRAS